MDEFTGFTDEQLKALISPVAAGIGKEGTSFDSGAVAVALLAQHVLDRRDALASLKAAKIKTAFEASSAEHAG